MAHPLHTSQSLRRLSEADYEVAGGEYDVRGWHVVAANDERVGKVDDLIIDPAAGKVRSLEVDVDRKIFALERDRRVLIPIGSAHLEPEHKDVVLSGMTRAALSNLPDYTGANLADDYDDVYRGHLSTAYPPKRITRSAEELRIDKRVEKKGDVRVAKHVETQRVRREVPVREQVHVERRQVNRTAGVAPEFRDDEIVVPVMEEEVVVEKQPAVKEELVISKEPVTTTKTVESDLRHEEVDVERSSGDVHINDKKTRGGR